MSNIDWVKAVEQYYSENPESSLDHHEVEAHLRNEYERMLEAKMTETELIYKFFADYPETGVIMKDGTLYAVTGVEDDVAQANEDNLSFWYNGETVADAIRKLYEALEKEQGE